MPVITSALFNIFDFFSICYTCIIYFRTQWIWLGWITFCVIKLFKSMKWCLLEAISWYILVLLVLDISSMCVYACQMLSNITGCTISRKWCLITCLIFVSVLYHQMQGINQECISASSKCIITYKESAINSKHQHQFIHSKTVLLDVIYSPLK